MPRFAARLLLALGWLGVAGSQLALLLLFSVGGNSGGLDGGYVPLVARFWQFAHHSLDAIQGSLLICPCLCCLLAGGMRALGWTERRALLVLVSPVLPVSIACYLLVTQFDVRLQESRTLGVIRWDYVKWEGVFEPRLLLGLAVTAALYVAACTVLTSALWDKLGFRRSKGGAGR